MRMLICAGMLIGSGCAWQGEALQVDADTYQTSANASPVRGGITGAQEMALTNANHKCASVGKPIHVLNIETGHAFPTNGVATVTFSCK